MSQIFHHSTNTFSRLSIFGGIFILAFLVWAWAELNASDYATRAKVPVEQPVPFSHEHHVGGLGIDCRYCHTSVENSSFAGIPPTKICMNCHSQIWNTSAMLEPVRTSFRSDESIRWIRVHDLPDYVYFNHSIHVAKGIGCTSCHGPINKMPLTWQQASLQMAWCLECHRHPERFVRPRSEVFNVTYQPPANQEELGRKLVREYKIQSLTSCSTCHR
ncbi:MAG: cytochrome C [Acidobacteria bacterium]|nr:MAG: cytochrome C [Acidobacteriota bacterium]